MSTGVPTGQTIAGYRIDDILGSGGMGVVYRATQLSLGRTVALKVLAPHLGGDPEFRERFRREAALQAGLSHPHVVQVYEAGETDEGLYVAFAYVEGIDLKRLLEDGPLEPERAVALIGQVASALDAAHDAGLVHRDVKPQNILVDTRDEAYLADFGLTKSGGSRGFTQTGTYMGSLDYVAPELLHGGAATPSSDLYSLAGVLYEAFTGEVPYQRDTEAALLYAHVSEPPPRASAVRPDLPPGLDDVLARGLAKEPEKRYATAQQLVEAAQGALVVAAAGAGAQRHARPSFGETLIDRGLLRRVPTITVPRSRELPGRVAFALVCVVVAALAAIGFLLGHSHTKVLHPADGVAVAGRLGLTFPLPQWRAATPVLPSTLVLSDPVALAGAGPASGSTLIAGIAPRVGGISFLPAALTGKDSQLVRIGPYLGLRYRGVAFGHRHATLYTVPVGLGAALVICRAPAATAARCDSVADSLLLRGITPGSVGPDPRVANVLRSTIGRLTTLRKPERSALATSKQAGVRASQAELLASAFANAAAQLQAVSWPAREKPAATQLTLALARARDGYISLGSAERAGDPASYRSAAAVVGVAERSVDTAIRSLGALGYRVPAAPVTKSKPKAAPKKKH